MSLRERWRKTRIYLFWRRLTEGLTMQELWTQFRKEATASYRNYTTNVPLAGSDAPRSRVARDVFWATLNKLSPARRIILLAALVLLVAPIVGAPHLTAFYAGMLLLGLLSLELADRVAMKRDMQIARDIQSWLLPHEPPVLDEADISFAAHPANTVAGDYLDVFYRRVNGEAPARSSLLFAVADVAGKSVPAALLSATLQASLRTAAHDDIPLPELVRRINLYACEHSLEGRRFTTGVFAELEPASGRLTYVNAGHNPPLLRHASGGIDVLEAGGLPLGIQPDAPYECRSISLVPGDLLVLYTDGVVEAENLQRAEYGDARLRDLLRDSANATSAQVVDRILASVSAFLGDAPQNDDITCFVVRYRGAGGA